MKRIKNISCILLIVTIAATMTLNASKKTDISISETVATGFKLDSTYIKVTENLERAKKDRDEVQCFKLYGSLSHYASMQGEYNMAKAYLDSMKYYKNKFDDEALAAIYYHSAGDHYQITGKEDLAHECYLKALDSYTNKSNKVAIIYNLSVYYHKHEIIPALKRLAAQAIDIANNSTHGYTKITGYKVAHNYYHTLESSNKHTEQEKQIAHDSTLFYINKIIETYEKEPSSYAASLIAYDYIAKAFLLVKSDELNDSTAFYREKAASLAAKTDTTMLLNLLYVDFDEEIKNKNYSKANEIATKQLELLSTWSADSEIISKQHANIYNELIELYIAIGDYETASSYFKKHLYHTKNLLDKEKLNMVENLQQKYESEKQKQKAEEALKEAKTNKFLYRVLLVLAMSLAGLSFFIYRWNKVKRDRDNKVHSLMELELQELDRSYQFASQELNMTVLKLQMIEIERSSREKDFQSLQERLDDILKKAEQEKEHRKNEKRAYHYTLVKNTLQKKLSESDKLDMYLERIDMLCDNFIAKLIEMGLTDGEIEYCVLFIIKASDEDISQYVSIKARYISRRKSAIKRDYFDEDKEKISFESRLFDLHQQYAEHPLPTTLFFDW